MVEFTIIPSEDGATWVRVSGECDLAEKKPTRQTLRHALQLDTDAIIVDLSACGFIDSAALRVLAAAHTDAVALGKDFVFVDSHLQVKRFLRILGYSQEFAIVSSRKEARALHSTRERRFAGPPQRAARPVSAAI